ncbi:hypothetical protein AF332_11185 [Sporosarcina globispora]|uniref:DUF559 domain-containing protein n=1 Tax=Sporosarcina globispora TaxID=1459 RepID=A0A0M0GC33_SPOGL|nr:hypothetical protein [Sporosarcina globispora]KON87333.1 hypothetical protein AF332_11185 [Sporosarcina globispora]
MTRSKYKCIFNCGTCNKQILKNKSQTQKITRGIAFCSLTCLGKYNGKERVNKVKKNCQVCDKVYEVIPARAETSVVCSKSCHDKWQSINLVGEKANRYTGGNRVKLCLYCQQDFRCEKPSTVRTRKFCTKECKNKYWIEHTLHNPEFSKAWFIGNTKSRNRQREGGETLPEKLVRNWLEDRNIEFIQEQGFFQKYFADFFIPTNNIIIEVMGDYWHGNPEIYGDGKKLLNEEQISRIKKDKMKKKDFIKYGYKYYEIWETDIYNDIDSMMNEIFPATTTRKTS